MTICLPRVTTVEAKIDVGNCLLVLHAAIHEGERVDNYGVQGSLLFLRDRQKGMPEKERVGP